jgi:predicted secreted hydrolase
MKRFLKIGILIWCLRVLGADELPSAPVTSDGFAIPKPGHRFVFPRDHGSHPRFKVEWWYVTGHLNAEDQRRFGFQATFFRVAGPPGATNSSALFGNSELHLAHMALLDVQAGRFLHEEKLNRAGWDAASSTETLDVRSGPWSLRLSDGPSEVFQLRGSIRAEAAFRLDLVPVKPLVIFGTNSVSRKSAEPSAASYYLTFSRLQASGELTVNGEKLTVRGQAWMDHEISSSQLAANQAGWDWASVQFGDGREIMVYRLRRKDGSTDPFSTLAWIDAEGSVTHFSSEQFEWTTDRTWKSPATGGVYPVGGRLRTMDPASNRSVTFTLEPLFLAQEIAGTIGGVPYWEGACRVRDATGAEVGSAFVELTGYVGDLAARFR